MNSEYRGLQVRNKYLEHEIEDYKITQDYATELEKEKTNFRMTTINLGTGIKTGA